MSVLNNISISMAGKLVSVVIQLVGTMIIARLLTPSELGVFAVAAAASTLLAALKNFGTSNYLIQCRAIDKPAVGSAFFATLLISAVLGLLLLWGSSGFAAFFDEPQIAPVLIVLAANFTLTPFITVGTALLIRSQNFKRLVLIEVAAACAAMLVSVVGATIGLGPMALALGTTVHSIATLLLILKERPSGLTFVPSVRDIRHVVGFGGWSSGAVLLNQLGSRANEFVIAKALNVASAAVFDKAASLPRLVGGQLFPEVLRVLLPVFAERLRTKKNVQSTYLDYMSILSTILAPLYVFLAFNAFPLIAILFGEQWYIAVPVASILALEYLLISPSLVGEKLLVADGKVKALFKIKAVQFALRLSALLFLVKFGLIAVGIGLVIAAVFYALLVQAALKDLLDLSWRDLAESFWHPLVALLGSLSVGFLTIIMFGYAAVGEEFKQIFVSFFLSVVMWLILAKVFGFQAYRIGEERLGAWFARSRRVGTTDRS